MQTKATRKRKPRAIAGVKPSAVTQEMKKLAAESHRENVVMNAAKRKSEKARKALYSEMKDAGIKSFDLITNIDGKDISLESIVQRGERTVIDTAALSSIVSKDQFLAIISASKSKVEQVAGKDVAVRVARTEPGTENVSIKVKK